MRGTKDCKKYGGNALCMMFRAIYDAFGVAIEGRQIIDRSAI